MSVFEMVKVRDKHEVEKKRFFFLLLLLNLHLTDSRGSKYLLNHDILFLLPQLFFQRATGLLLWQDDKLCHGPVAGHDLRTISWGHQHAEATYLKCTHTHMHTLKICTQRLTQIYVCMLLFSLQAVDQQHIPPSNTTSPRKCLWHTSGTVGTPSVCQHQQHSPLNGGSFTCLVCSPSYSPLVHAVRGFSSTK